ncbi:MAG: hypothetical protein ACYC0J_10025 [Gammaproteobacteria bacterium]
MALFEAMRQGAGFIDDLRRGKMLQDEADYKRPFLQEGLLKSQTENQYLPDRLRLANEHAGLINKWYEPNMQSEIGYRGVLSNEHSIRNKYLPAELEAAIREKQFYSNHPLMKLPGAAGQIGAAMFLRDGQNGGGLSAPFVSGDEGQQMPPGNNNQNPPPNGNQQYSDDILKSLSATSNAKIARADLDKERTRNFNWGQLPVEVRNNLVAQGAGMGVDPVKMKNYVAEGLNLQQIAEREGLDPQNIPSPIYPPTGATKTRVQQQQQISAELDYISSALTPIIKPYADTFFGKSPAAISDMMSGDEKAQKRFGEYMGALALQTELASGRLNLAGAKSGVELTKELKARSLAGIHQISPVRLTGTAFQASQDLIDHVLQRGAKIRTTTGMSPFTKPTQDASPSQEESNRSVVKWTRDASGKLVKG